MTNKELISLLSGVSMKSEVEIIVGKTRYAVDRVKRLHVPENEETGAAAKNLVQIVVKDSNRDAHEGGACSE